MIPLEILIAEVYQGLNIHKETLKITEENMILIVREYIKTQERLIKMRKYEK